MDTKLRIGLADVTILGGWLTDRNVREHEHETVEYDPIIETTTTTTHHSEGYRDHDGDVRRRHWSTVDERDDQVGTVSRSVTSRSRSVNYRIRLDDGRLTQPGWAPRRSGENERIHRVAIAHPLIRGGVATTVFSLTPSRIVDTAWRRLILRRAIRGAEAAIAADRMRLMQAVRTENPHVGIEYGCTLVIEGKWDADRRRLLTTFGPLALPRARGIEDGTLVGGILRSATAMPPLSRRSPGIVMEAWQVPGERPWRRRWAPVTETLFERLVPLCLMLAALLMVVAAIRLQDGLVLTAAAVIGIAGLALLNRGRDQRAGRRRSREQDVGDGLRMMQLIFWKVARKKWIGTSSQDHSAKIANHPTSAK